MDVSGVRYVRYLSKLGKTLSYSVFVCSTVLYTSVQYGSLTQFYFDKLVDLLNFVVFGIGLNINT